MTETIEPVAVFVYEATEQVGSVHTDACGRGVDSWFGSCCGWSLVKGSVWPVAVVVGRVFSEDGSELAFADYQEPIQALAADGADPPLAFGAGGGLRSISIPAPPKTASNPVVNLVSRSSRRPRQRHVGAWCDCLKRLFGIVW